MSNFFALFKCFIIHILCFLRKFEEIYPPDVGEFVYITDDTYSKKQVLRMEQLILKVLSFDLSIPTPLTFINAICIGNQIPDKTMFLAMVSLLNCFVGFWLSKRFGFYLKTFYSSCNKVYLFLNGFFSVFCVTRFFYSIYD